MSKKVYQQLVAQNSVTIDELRHVYGRMETATKLNHWQKWNELNETAAKLIGDLQAELDAAYALQPIESVRRQGKKKFWQLVNELVQ